MTLPAKPNMMATSFAEPDRTGRSVPLPAPPAVVPENAPNKVEVSGRPIALAIRFVSNVPDAPTSVPAMSSRTLPRT